MILQIARMSLEDFFSYGFSEIAFFLIFELWL